MKYGRTPNRPYNDFGRNGKKLNVDLWYDHCERHGHTKDICYKLVGYSKNKNQDKGKAIVNSVQVPDGPTVSTANNNDFTVERIKVIQEMIGKPTFTSGKNKYNINLCYNISNFDRMIDYKNNWLLDSGASAHKIGNRKFFISLRRTSKIIKAKLSNGLLKEID